VTEGRLGPDKILNKTLNRFLPDYDQSQTMEWTPEQYRSAYHFNRFTAGWRQLLVFYVAM
jgi:hypothetical protein